MELLIISFYFKKEYYRISVHSQYASDFTSRASKYGQIDAEASLVYASDNKALIQGVKSGLITYLSNHYLSPGKVGVGSSEFFDIKSINKCKYLLEIYMNELTNINFLGSLDNFPLNSDNYSQRLNKYNSDTNFLNTHDAIIKQIDSAIAASLSFVTFKKRDNYYILSDIDTREIEINNIPIFEWVQVRNNDILFDINVINVWKKDGRYKDTRRLIEMKFFNEFTLKNIRLYYDMKEERNNDNV